MSGGLPAEMPSGMLEEVAGKWRELLDIDELKTVDEAIGRITMDELVCPPRRLWFEWARLTDLDNIKVIILGQDSYYTKNTAHGLAFSSLSKKIPPSLLNIYKCLHKHGLMDEIPKHSNLTSWAKQGVLLLNAALSTELGIPNKHAKIWEKYMNIVMSRISNYGRAKNRKYTYLLWGRFAQKYKSIIDTDWHEVLEWLHPSPMAQNHAPEPQKFINCPHFSLCAEKHGIVWDDTVPHFAYAGIRDAAGPHLRHVAETQMIDDPDVIQVFTDGSCLRNGKKGATGGFSAVFVAGPLKGKRIKGKIKSNATNIRAEGYAIISAMELISKLNGGWKKAIIYSDSEFWIKMLTVYIPNWTESRFAKQKNADMTKKIYNLYKSMEPRIELRWVPAHNKTDWKNSKVEYERWCHDCNEIADSIAYEMAKAAA